MEEERLIAEIQGIEKVKLTLRAVWGKQQGQLILYPPKHGITERIVGVQEMSPHEKLNAKRVVDENTSRKIVDGLVIDLNDPIDKIDWQWIRQCKEIAESLDDAQHSQAALFYVEDIDGEIIEKIRTSDLKFEAMKYVKESSEVRKSEIARLLGKDSRYLRPIDIHNYLMDEAEHKPKVIINAYRDKDAKTKLFLLTLKQKKIVKVDNNGFIRYNEEMLGVNEDAAIQWLKDPKNSDFIKQFHLLINPGYGKPESTKQEIKEEIKGTIVADKTTPEDVDEKIKSDEIKSHDGSNESLKIEADTKQNDSKSSIKPVNKEKGWHLQKEFIDDEGNVFHKGKFVGKIKVV